MIFLNNKLMYEHTDLEVGEVYRSGKKNFVISSISYDHFKRKNFGADKDTNPWIEQEGTRVHAIETITGDKYIIPPSQLSVKSNSNSFNRAIFSSEQELVSVQDLLADKESPSNVYNVIYSDKASMFISFSKGFIVCDLKSQDGTFIATKKSKKVEFLKKISIKNNDFTYSIMFVNPNPRKK